MTTERYSFNWERGHPNFWDNYCDLADCYLTCEDVVNRLNELDTENRKLKNELNLSKLNLKEKNEGFDKIHKMYIEQIEESKELKEKNKFILWQIKAFRDDCYTAIDFDGASTLNRLLDILGEER